MKKLLFATLAFSTLLSQASFAQSIDDGEINLGVGRTEYLNSELGATSLKIDYRSVDGMYFPVSIDFGKDVKSISAGFGYKTGKELSQAFAYSVAAAVNHLRISEDVESVMKEDRNKFTLLFKQELTFQLNSRLALGVNYSIDVLNRGLVHKAKWSTTPESYPSSQYNLNENGTYSPKPYIPGIVQNPNAQYTPDYASMDEKNASLESIKKSSASSFGVSLKFRLGK